MAPSSGPELPQVVDHAIPRESVEAVRYELSEGTDRALAALTPEERQRPGLNGCTRELNQLTLQPLFAEHVCQPAVVGIAQSALDAHVRITATGTRNFKGGFGPEANRGPDGREWHTGVHAPLAPSRMSSHGAPVRLATRSVPGLQRRYPSTIS